MLAATEGAELSAVALLPPSGDPPPTAPSSFRATPSLARRHQVVLVTKEMTVGADAIEALPPAVRCICEVGDVM